MYDDSPKFVAKVTNNSYTRNILLVFSKANFLFIHNTPCIYRFLVLILVEFVYCLLSA